MSLRRTVLLLLALAAVAVAFSAWAGVWRHETTPREIRERLGPRIRPGATRAEVLAVLDSLRVEHSGPGDSRDTVFAIWRHTGGSMVCDHSIQGRFYFDARGHLVRDTLSLALTCL